jgi:aminopeptidase YwaD
MKSILISLLFISQLTFAQRLKKADRKIVEDLKRNIGYLADDKLEGRRVGTPGEKLAYEYISNQFKAAGLEPKGENGYYLQEFEINDGKQINPGTIFRVNETTLYPGKDFIPMAFSPNSPLIEAAVAVSLSEKGVPWFKDLDPVLENNLNNPHFDIEEYIKTEAMQAAQKGARALVLYNTSAHPDKISFEKKDKSPVAPIPVLYLTKAAKEKYFKDESATYDVKIKVDLGESKRTGHNVVGYINNNAFSTIIIGAHYDHLGYGEDGNSMLHTGERLIHNGADDNASGTAALIELANLLSKTKAKGNNYLFIAFSGEELGLFGSKYFTEHPTIDLANTNYMINMDMVGRLNDSSKTLTIGGYGTSPIWSSALYSEKRIPFTIKIDSSGTGPSDHTSFYRKDIPVLFFFTGIHSDYHKPTDDAIKINYTGEMQIIRYIYGLIGNLNSIGKLSFTKTREQPSSSPSRFSVTLGIMPDYTFNGTGVRVDGVSDGKPAQKAGLKTGDVITQLGDYHVSSLENYMEALSKFKKGDSTKVKIKRGNEEKLFDISF